MPNKKSKWKNENGIDSIFSAYGRRAHPKYTKNAENRSTNQDNTPV